MEPKLSRKIYKRKVKKQKKIEQHYEQPAFVKEEDKQQIENVDLNLNLQQLQHQMQLQQQIQFQQQQQQFCLSLQGTCDTKSQENRKDLSTPISLASFYPQFNDEVKNEQLKQFLNQNNRQNHVVSPLYQNSASQQAQSEQKSHHEEFLRFQSENLFKKKLINYLLDQVPNKGDVISQKARQSKTAQFIRRLSN